MQSQMHSDKGRAGIAERAPTSPPALGPLRMSSASTSCKCCRRPTGSSGGRGVPRHASGYDERRYCIAWRSSAFPAGLRDPWLAPVDNFPPRTASELSSGYPTALSTDPQKILVDRIYQSDYICARLSYCVSHTCRSQCSPGGDEKERLMNPVWFAPFSRAPAMICPPAHVRFLWRPQLLTRT
jgi:hypothetical protein